MENLDRDLEREYTREELELLLWDFEFLVEKAKEQIKELDEKEAQEAELDAEAGVEVPEDYVYVLADNDNLQIHTIGEDICYECAEDLSRLGLIRTDSDSAWVSARRNIRANRLEALAHSIGGAYEFEIEGDNYFIFLDTDGIFQYALAGEWLEPEKIYMTEKTAEQVCEILNSGTYKLNIDVAIEDDEFCEECCCDACAGNDC
mgnify:CR=1 FL=1